MFVVLLDRVGIGETHKNNMFLLCTEQEGVLLERMFPLKYFYPSNYCDLVWDTILSWVYTCS